MNESNRNQRESRTKDPRLSEKTIMTHNEEENPKSDVPETIGTVPTRHEKPNHCLPITFMIVIGILAAGVWFGVAAVYHRKNNIPSSNLGTVKAPIPEQLFANADPGTRRSELLSWLEQLQGLDEPNLRHALIEAIEVVEEASIAAEAAPPPEPKEPCKVQPGMSKKEMLHAALMCNNGDSRGGNRRRASATAYKSPLEQLRGNLRSSIERGR